MHLHFALACAAIVAAGDLPDLIVVPVAQATGVAISHHTVAAGEVYVVSGTIQSLVTGAAYWHPQPDEEVFVYCDDPDPSLLACVRAYTKGVIRICGSMPLKLTAIKAPSSRGYGKYLGLTASLIPVGLVAGFLTCC